MKKKLLVVTAHPDDESFGPGGTIAYYAKSGVEVHVVCATRGEMGEDNFQFPISNFQKKKKNKKAEIHDIREKELLNAAKVLGVKQVDFLDFIDGTLNNQQYHLVSEKIIQKIADFKPQVVMTYDPKGGSGHLDHVAISFITTYSYFKSKIPKKLYYYCLPKFYTDQIEDFRKQYFIYFPSGYKKEEITTQIDVSSVKDTRIRAIKQHKSQWKDVKHILNFLKMPEKSLDYYILHDSKVKTKDRETDLFEGIV